MRNLTAKWEFTGAVIIILLGIIFHFVYDWSCQWKPVALVAPVNESVWEHLKLVLWPTLIFAAVEYRYIGAEVNNFLTAKMVSIYAAMALIIIIFYSYTALLGRNLLVLDILTFILSVAAGQYLGYVTMTLEKLPLWTERLSSTLIALTIFTFFVFTFNPPRLPIFRNPVDGSYGI